MDEYKEYLYNHNPNRYKHISPGNITKQLTLREHLQCKPFKWYIENVAFDLPKKYPFVEPTPFASGFVKSMSAANLCIDNLGHSEEHEIGLYPCHSLTNPSDNQNWIFSWRNEIKDNSDLCWDVPDHSKNKPVLLFDCHTLGGNQFWKYNKLNNWIISGSESCLDFDNITKTVFVNKCDKHNPNMKWQWGLLSL